MPRVGSVPLFLAREECALIVRALEAYEDALDVSASVLDHPEEVERDAFRACQLSALVRTCARL